MTCCFIFDTTSAFRTWAIESMVEAVVTDVRKIDSYFSQPSHSVPVMLAEDIWF